MNIFNSPVSKRTRLQWQLFSEASRDSCRKNRAALSQAQRAEEALVDESSEEEESSESGSEGSSRSSRRKLDETKTDEESLVGSEEETSSENAKEANLILIDDDDDDDELYVNESEEETNSKHDFEGSSVLRKRKHEEAKWIDDDDNDELIFVDDSEDETNDKYGSGGTSRQISRLITSNTDDHKYSLDGSKEKESDGEESHHSMKVTDGDKETNNIEFANIALKNHGFGSASFSRIGNHTYFRYSSDDSDSDDRDVTIDEEETDEDVCKYDQDIQNLSSENDEYESSSESKSESVNWENIEFSLLNKIPNQPINMKESPIKNTREKAWSTSVDREGKSHSAPKTNVKKANLKPMSGSMLLDIDTHEKTIKNKSNDCYMPLDKANAVKNQEYLKPRSRAPRINDGAYVASLLDSVIENEDTHHKEGDNYLPLRFRFSDSEDESSSQETDEIEIEVLFKDMDLAFTCEKIGSYTTPAVETLEKNDDNDDENETNHLKSCQRGDHSEVYLEDQTGFRCCLCGAVVLESRYVIPKLANYAPDKTKRSYHHDEQLSTSGNVDFGGPEWNNLDVHDLIKGTVWELIPPSIQAHLYPHQQDGFKFLWKNLAGTLELSEIQNFDSRGGGGCIISHAPGTGKTLLTIVFLDTFLKKFPSCCPVIVSPVSMLLTWEAEFKKWQVGFSFLNLNSSDSLSNDKVNGKISCNRDVIRAMKISSWSNGGSVLGVSYNLYEKLVGNMKNKILEKMGNVLLDKPGLVVLDEGHTPRNQRSNIWNALKKLKTKRRVILSGTPFQNNFRELFNTLHLVRPNTWTNIMNQMIFSDMIKKYRKKSRSGSDADGIEKLKAIISPFVHVHKGKILESKLPGLKSCVIFLNPPPLQMSLIKSLGNQAKNFEYEHKVALVSVHPSLILCSLSEKEKHSKNIELKKVRLQPDFGVKTSFVMELIRLSTSLDEKVLIFSQYIEPLKLLKDQIAHVFGWNEGRETMVIEGKINHKQRQVIINGFNDPNSEVKVLLASTRCCSEGIHLIGASRVVLLDVVWNPSVERQAISRAYRLGQKKVVYTYHLMASGTTEEDKYDRQVEKAGLGELIFFSSAMAGDEQKSNEKVNASKLNDKILQQMVDHQEFNHIFKEIRYPEKQTTF